MKKNLIFPLIVSTLFVPSIEAIERATDLNSFENENNILISDCGGSGGGGGGVQAKKARKARQEKAKKLYKKRKAQEIRNRQKVINKEGYVGAFLQGARETALKIKTKIENEKIPSSLTTEDFFKRLDEKMAELKFLKEMLNVIDELQVVKATPTAMRDEKWMKFYKETYKPFLDLKNQMPEGLNTHEMRSAINILAVDVGFVAGSASQDYVDQIDKNKDGIPDS